MKLSKKIALPAIALAALGSLSACTEDDANVASQNLSKAADNFEIQRRVVFYNGITEDYILAVEGRCSVVDEGNQLEVTCKTGKSEYKKHFLGLSDNVSYFAEQLDSAKVSSDHYRVTFKPETIIPDLDVRVNTDEMEVN